MNHLIILLLFAINVAHAGTCADGINAFFTIKNNSITNILIETKHKLNLNLEIPIEQKQLLLDESATKLKEVGITTKGKVLEIDKQSFATFYFESANKDAPPFFQMLTKLQRRLNLEGFALDLDQRLGNTVEGYFDPGDLRVHIPLSYLDRNLKSKSPSETILHESMHAVFDRIRRAGKTTPFDQSFEVIDPQRSQLPGDVGMYKTYFSLEEFYTFTLGPHWLSKTDLHKLSNYEMNMLIQKMNAAPEKMRKIALKVINLVNRAIPLLQDPKTTVTHFDSSIEFSGTESFIFRVDGTAHLNDLQPRTTQIEKLTQLKRVAESIYNDQHSGFPTIKNFNDLQRYRLRAKEVADWFRHEL